MAALLEISIKSGLDKLEQDLLKISKALGDKAANTALARTVARTRLDMRAALPSLFDRPTPFTMNSVRFSVDPGARAASIYISEDAAKGTPPATYLRAEIVGGARRDKRSERALIARGFMEPDQQMVPGEGAPLNSFGNISRGMMTRILSRIGAHGEQGYQANATARTRRRRAKARLAVKSTGTDYFVKRDKDGRPEGVYQLLAGHKVRPVLIFANRRAHYHVRFDFGALAEKSFAELWPIEMRRAFHEAMDNLGLKAK